jgi:hypothetical protein
MFSIRHTNWDVLHLSLRRLSESVTAGQGQVLKSDSYHAFFYEDRVAICEENLQGLVSS